MPRDQSYSLIEIEAALARLDPEDRKHAADGGSCIDCGSRHGGMVPVGYYRGVQVFAHYPCNRRGSVFIGRDAGIFVLSKPWELCPVMDAEAIDRLGDVFHLPRPLWPPDVAELFSIHGAGLLAGTVEFINANFEYVQTINEALDVVDSALAEWATSQLGGTQ